MASSSELEHKKRQEIRHKYRNLMSETQLNHLELINPDSTGLNDALDEADKLFDDVKASKGTREAAMDSSFLVIASSLGKQRAQKLHTDLVTFDPREFVEKLLTYMSGRSLESQNEGHRRRHIPLDSWRELAREAKGYFRKAPALHFMLGSFGKDEPQRRRRQQQPQEKEVGPTAVPKQLSSTVQTHQEVTTEEVGKIMAILLQFTRGAESQDASQIEPVRLFDFVMNPHSYGQTIENLFYISFLIKDGHAKIELDGDDLPVILPCEPYKEGQSRDIVQKKQVMVSLTMEKWKEIIDVFEIVEPLIPTRQSVDL